MTFGLVFFVVGLIQSTWAIWAIRSDAAKDRVSLIETAVLKISDSDPFPKSRSGLAFDRAIQWVILLFGLVFVAVGSLILLAEI